MENPQENCGFFFGNQFFGTSQTPNPKALVHRESPKCLDLLLGLWFSWSWHRLSLHLGDPVTFSWWEKSVKIQWCLDRKRKWVVLGKWSSCIYLQVEQWDIWVFGSWNVRGGLCYPAILVIGFTGVIHGNPFSTTSTHTTGYATLLLLFCGSLISCLDLS